MVDEKLPPHDVAAEEAVIGSLLIDSEAIARVATYLKGEDFFTERTQWCYEACCSLYQRQEIVDQITTAHELARQGRLEAVGGAAYLSYLISNVPTSLHVEYYAQVVSRLATMRRLINAAGQIAAIAYEAGPDVDAALSTAEDILFRLRYRLSTRDFVSIRQVLDQYFEESAPVRQKGEHIPHALTGFTALDDFLGGFQRADLIVLAARPSLGKSSLALSIARNAAVEQGACVALFSLEMSRESLVQRLLAAESGVDSRRVRLGLHTEDEERRIMDATGVLSEAPIYIDDSPQPRMAEVRSKARRFHMEREIDLVIVDYLGLIQGESRGESRVQEISAITRSLKALARELDVPVLAISQLSRAVEWRASHVPQLFDLRDSGSIEQDADVVLFIYRDEVYYTVDEWNKLHDIEKEPYPRGIADIMIAKHRNGPTGKVELRFIAKTAKFDNLQVEQGLKL